MNNVLIVEDIPHVTEWLVNAATEAFPAAQITSADSLMETREQLKCIKPDLLLLDIGLPDGSGLDLMPLIKDHHPECVVIISTLFDDDDHVFKALRLGAKGYVLKDQSKADMAALLRGLRFGQLPISPAIANKLLLFFNPLPQTNQLTPRETEVLTLIAKGLTVPRVAELLAIKSSTCYSYIKSIYQKLNINSRAEAAMEASRLGLINPEHN